MKEVGNSDVIYLAIGDAQDESKKYGLTEEDIEISQKVINDVIKQSKKNSYWPKGFF